MRNAIRSNAVEPRENTDSGVKSDVWKTFQLCATKEMGIIFGWCACKICHCCIKFKSSHSDGSTKSYGTKNMQDHIKSCTLSSSRQMSMTSFVQKRPNYKLPSSDQQLVKDAEIRMVVEGGTSFSFVDSGALHSFAQTMINIGSCHGNVSVSDVLFGRKAIRNGVIEKMKVCQERIRRLVESHAKRKQVAFTTDLSTDDVNKNSYLDFTIFWINDEWKLSHALYKCHYFSERHSAFFIKEAINSTLNELGLSTTETPCTTDRGANIVAATNELTHIDCLCHRINTIIDVGWSNACKEDFELKSLNQHAHELVTFVLHSSGIQSQLPCSLKHGGVTRPWRSLFDMFESIRKSYDELISQLRQRKKEYLISRINVDLLREVTNFLKNFSFLFDLLEYADIPSIQNGLPVYFTIEKLCSKDEGNNKHMATLKNSFFLA